jgi:glycosyltransferase involved in cell wall biosynthesis
VSTRDRPERLARLLASLRAQALDPASFEVIVVDDGSSHETESLLARELERPGPPVRPIRHEVSRGPAAARNTGWRAARAPLVAFTDDDCAPDRHWLRAALALHDEHPGAILQGRTEPDPSELGLDGLLSRTVAVRSLGPQYETCNVFYPRRVLESLGGFDERYGPRPAAEDTDLAWRAIERGHRTVFAPEALVFHAVQRLGAGGMLRVASRWDEAIRVFADHPATRTMLYRGTFWNVWHYLWWRSLLALAGPRWLRTLVLTRHLVELRLRAGRARAGPGAIPFLLVHDTVECWAVARGALRYRTLVL